MKELEVGKCYLYKNKEQFVSFNVVFKTNEPMPYAAKIINTNIKHLDIDKLLNIRTEDLKFIKPIKSLNGD